MQSLRARLALWAIPALALWASQGFASPDFIKVNTNVYTEQWVVGADGKRRVQRVPAANVRSGSEVIYEVGYSNTGPQPMQVVITNPLPADLVYQSYAARSVGAQLEVSVDGGVSFAPLTTQVVRGLDGQTRPATAADITHVRWKTARPIRPGEAGYVSLRAKVK
ncbi:MAG: conserved repeat domain [Panacagrimonas sp.]|jgi:uncharacterized repeat protein (TIGR01451 family)|nr:hypothetical protein [Panacagrimonas sp.]MCC2655649.1 conserved repeat domain [Panacagrimonas sp.]